MGRTSRRGGSRANRALGPDDALDYKPNEIRGTTRTRKQEGGGRGRKCCICRFCHNLTVACEYESINK
jgi:hypothetical protein